MKYLLLTPLMIISFIIACICYLWRFDSEDFDAGLAWLDTKTDWTKYL